MICVQNLTGDQHQQQQGTYPNWKRRAPRRASPLDPLDPPQCKSADLICRLARSKVHTRAPYRVRVFLHVAATVARRRRRVDMINK